MASLRRIRTILLIFTLILAMQMSFSTGIGVNFGRNGDNLPSPQNVVSLYKKCGIKLLRLFEPNPDILEALKGSNLQVSLGVKNGDVQSLASSKEAANQWVNTNVAPYKGDVNFKWIVLGNEIIPGAEGIYATQAMKNIKDAINSIGLTKTIVTTSFYMPGIATSYPPSAGAFTKDVVNVMKDVTAYLLQTGAPLMANVYPYYAYTSNPKDIKLEYATFQTTNTVVVDGGLSYSNLFDAMVDSVYAALGKINAGNVSLVIGETGWPTAGNEPYSSKENAKTYNKNLIQYVQSGKGTPKKPNQTIDVFIFAMFNENQKTTGIEQNWGLFYPNMSHVYPLLNC
ncbi:glucan endo-1,3-beta-glucosidase-like [Trifolium pratense]|uniref:glucan endo-1,3-beta-glucosidase-like n=1 Tax=Trifolium pratense TaxID=57577 RepID=UPI001E694632|nr:glucan endo-1,3-beta-glucosidase-like [Trifolium pratense]